MGTIDTGSSVKPRPEARAYLWSDLIKSNKIATKELFEWLNAAISTVSEKDEGDEHLATSLLISGERGSGKTTILLTMASALMNPEELMKMDENKLFDLRNKKNKTQEEEEKEVLFGYMKNRSRDVVWLNTLDLESVPLRANLLATMLVRVRGALENECFNNYERSKVPPSLLEEGLENSYGELDRLVHDATFMWEEIQAQDLHQRTGHQIKMAETFAEFQRRFRKIMKTVSKELTRRKFGQTNKPKVIL